jgi:23S rRNA (guanine2445-N2)-methyltransferase / 23S rRNA (guanine2069-N7)-methyltransferase
VSCYRIYDADMPEYSFAIDRYAEADGARVWLYVQEYAAPRTVDPNAAQRRRNEALAALPGVTGVPAGLIHLRQRRITTRRDQYEKLGEQGESLLVEESGLRFWVNFTDYLDTGLFLDHRITRQRLRERPRASASSTCSPTPAAPRCTPPRAGRAKPRPSTCRPPTSIGPSAIWR